MFYALGQIMNHEDIYDCKEDLELTLDELELVKGGMNYAGSLRYRAQVLNTHKIRLSSDQSFEEMYKKC